MDGSLGRFAVRLSVYWTVATVAVLLWLLVMRAVISWWLRSGTMGAGLS